MKDILSLTLFGRNVKVQCEDARTKALLLANYGSLRGTPVEASDLSYTAGLKKSSDFFFIKRRGEKTIAAADDGEFLFLFEKDMTMELQNLRPDLYFVHAAVLESMGKAFMLVAPSGGGKSTTAWGLLHHGFAYLSDELGPIDLRTFHVHPYPHAICLKDKPPRPYPLPGNTVYTSRTIHIPTENLPGKPALGPLPLQAIFFLRYSPDIPELTLQPISKGQATARIFAATLNLLAHPGEGLDAAVAIAKQCPSFEVSFFELSRACELLRAWVDAMFPGKRLHSREFPDRSALTGDFSV